MASKEQIGIKQQKAFDRIKGAMAQVEALTGVAVSDLPRTGRGDPAFIHAQQLEVVADYLEALETWLAKAIAVAAQVKGE